MSEHQYYGFRAIDRPLSEQDVRWLHGLSTRAHITTTSFVNVYNWGDFRGDPVKLMERCFDVFVHVANWGYRRFMVRLPITAFDAAGAEPYCDGGCVSLRKTENCVLLDCDCDFDYEEEPDECDEWDDGAEWLASLTPLRGALLDGDLRCLYLAWLRGIELESLSDDDVEPPVPAGLKDLSASLQEFADFISIDSALVEVAAERSGPRAADEPSPEALKDWIRSLAVAEKDELLLRIAEGDEPNPRRSLMRSVKEATQACHATCGAEDTPSRRTVAEIAGAWQQRVQERQRRAAEQAAKERERRAQAEAQARKEHLEDVASRAPAVWSEVAAWMAKRSPKGYDRAVALLTDLRDAAALAGCQEDFRQRLDDFRDSHAGKPAFMRRLRDAGLAR